MKKIFTLCVLMALVCVKGWGQASMLNYTFATNNTSSLVTMTGSTTLLSGSGLDDVASSVASIGFDFFLYGNRYTQFSVTSNGTIGLGGTAVTTVGTSTGSTTTPIIAPFGGNQGVLTTGGKVHYLLSGSAPNRILTVEWLNMKMNYSGYSTATTGDGTYQARLYESSGIVEFIYGNMSVATTFGTGPVIGLSVGTSANQTLAVTSSSNSSASGTAWVNNSYTTGAITNLNSSANGSRRMYRFIPPGNTGNTLTTSLSAPTSLTFTSVTTTSETLNWNAPSTTTGILKYDIYYSTDNATFSWLASTSLGTNTYTASSLTSGQTYYWKVYSQSEGALSTALVNSQATVGTFTSTTGGGNWSSTSTWSTGVVPTLGSVVNIVGPVTIDNTSGTITNSNVINVNTGGTLLCAYTSGSSLAGAGTVNINGTGTLDIEQGAYPGNTNTFAYATTATLKFNNTSGSYGVNSTEPYWPTSSGPQNVNVAGAGGITLNGSRTVATLFQTSGPVTLANSSVLTLSGINQLNSGGSFTNAPTYASTSTLIYNTTGTYGVASEWTGNSTTAGLGVPQAVTIQNSTTVSMPSTNRGLAGTLTINSGGLTLNSTSGDLYVGGSWTRAASTTFTPNNRAVFFNGSGTQTITASIGGGEVFNYLLSQGSGTIKLASAVTVNANNGLTLSSTNTTSTIDLNGQTLTLSGGGNLSLSTGARKITNTSATAGVVAITGSTLTVANGGSLVFGNNVTVALSQPMDFGVNVSTIGAGTSGILQLNNNGSVANNAPIYATGSLLQYNTGVIYGRGTEWSGAAVAGTAGYPYAVQVTGNTTLDAGATSNTALPLNVANNLTIDAGSSLYMDYSGHNMTVPLNIGGTLTLSGNLSESGVSGGDINLAGNFVNNGTAANFFANSRAFTFNGTVAQTIGGTNTNVGGYAFAYLTINNTTSGGGVTLSKPITVANVLALTKGTLTTTSTNTLSITNTATGAITGGSTGTNASFINGPVNWSLPANLGIGSTYTFPVGSGTVYLPFALNNPITGATAPVVTVQAFSGTFSGTTDGTLASVSTTEYWLASATGSFTSTSVSLTRQIALSGVNAIGYSSALSGPYTYLGGTVSGTSITNSSSTSVLGYFRMATTPTQYYSKSTGNLDVLATWGTNTDGTGTAPASFTANAQIFNIRNNASPTIGANWIVNGTGSKVILGDGTNAVNFTVPALYTLTVNTGAVIDISNNATLTILNTTTSTITFGTINANSTVNYGAAGTQTIIAANYGNLTLGGSGTRTFPSGVVGIAGTFTPGVFTSTTTGTIDFSSAGAQTIPAFTYYNLTNTGNGARTLASNGTVGIAGTIFTPGSGAYTVTGSTVNFSGANAITIPVLTAAATNNYNNLTVSGSSTYTFGGSVIMSGDYLQNGTGTVYVNNGATGYNLTVAGNFTLSGGPFYMQNTSTGLGCTVSVAGSTGTTTSGTSSIYMDFGGAAVANKSIFQTTNFSSTSTSTKVIDFGGSSTAKNNEFRVSGNFTKTSSTGQLYTSGTPVNGGLVFNGTGTTQTVNITASTNAEYYNVTINANAVVQLGAALSLGAASNPPSYMTVNGTLNCGAFSPAILGGSSGSFTLASGATLITANTAGVVSGTSGSISTSIPTLTFDPGANYTFNGSSAQTTNFVTTTMNNLTIANTSGGVTNNTVVSVSGVLTLTNGILTPGNSTNVVTVTNSAVTAISGGSAASYVNGALNRAFPANASVNASTYAFPLGAGTAYLPAAISNFTTGTTGPIVQMQAFTGDAGGGPDGTTVGSLSNTEYWSATLVSGNFTNGSFSLTRNQTLGALNTIAKSSLKNGSLINPPAYASINGTISGNSINNSDAATLPAYLVLATKLAACTVPTAPSNVVLGASTTSTQPITITPAGTPSGYMVISSTSSSLSATPVAGTTYTVGQSFGGGIVQAYGSSTTPTASSSLVSNTNYYYFVYSYNSGCSGTPPLYSTSYYTSGGSAPSRYTCVTAPTSLANTSSTSTTATVSWATPNGTITSYTIKYGTTSGSYTTTINNISTNPYTITGLSGGTTYYYVVIANNSNSNSGCGTASANSTEGTITTTCGTFTATISVGGTTGQYPNLTQAIAALSRCGISQATTLELNSSYDYTTETFPIALSAITGMSSANTITIRPASGTTQSITSSNTTATFNINGGKYWVIDGRAGGAGTTQALTISNTSTTSSTTNAAIQLVNDAQNNLIEYTNVKALYSSTTSGEIVFGTTTGTASTSGNNNNTITYCNIDGGAGNAAQPTTGAQIGIYSSGVSTSIPNSGNTISNNNIYDQFVAVSTGNTDGIYLANSAGWTITNNKIFQTATRTAIAGNTYRGIYVNTSSGGGYTITNNTIGYTNASGTGTMTYGGGFANRFIGIDVLASTPSSSIQGNTIAGISMSTTSGATGNYGIFSGIYLEGGTADIGSTTGNTIGASSGTGSISVTSSTASAYMHGIAISTSTSTAVTVQNNIIASMTMTNNGGLLTGIYLTNTTTSGLNTVSKNKVYNLVSAATGTVPYIYGIYEYDGNSNFSNNMISLTNTGNTNPVYMYGMYDAAGSTYSCNYYFNTVYIGGNAASGSAISAGYYRSSIYATTVNLKNNIFNNARSGGTGVQYSIVNAYSTPSTGWTSDYNAFSSRTTTMGRWYTTDETFANWIAASGGDTHSVWGQNTSAANPYISFIDTTTGNLHVTTDNNCALAAGIAITGYTTDYDGDTRVVPDIGADEFTSTFTLVITNPAAVCSGTSVDLTTAAVTAGSTSGVTLSYYTNSAGTTTLSNPNAVTVSGTYYIKAVKGTCSSIKPVVVTINPATAINGTVATPAATCSGSGIQTLTVSATGTGLTYTWRKNGTAVTNGGVISGQGTATLTLTNPTISDAGSYDVVVTGTCAPTSVTSNAVTVTVNPNQSIALGSGAGSDAQSVCSGSSITAITYNVSGTGASITGGNLPAGFTGTYSSGVFTITGSTTVTTTTTYNYTVTTTGTCAAATASGTITVNPLPVVYNFNATSLTSCADNPTAQLILANSQTGVNYQLYRNGVATGSPIAGSTGSQIDFGKPTVSGTYTVTGTYNTPTACNIQMNGNPTITVTTINNYTVTGSGISCGSGTLVLSNSQTGTTYQLIGPQSVPNQSGTDGTALTFTVTTSGTYYIFASAGSCNRTMNSGTGVTVTVNPVPSVTGTYTPSICSGGSFSVTPTSSVNGTTYTWTTPTYAGTGSSISGGAAQTTGQSTVFGTLSNNGNNSGTATYTVTPATSTCTGSTFTVTVTVNPLIKATIAAPSTPPCSGAGSGVTINSATGGIIYYHLSTSATVARSVTLSAGSGSTLTDVITSPTTYTLDSAKNTGGGCLTFISGSITVTPNALPNAAITANSYVQIGGPVLTLTGATNGGTWSTNNGNLTLANQTSNSVDATAAALGTANVTYTVSQTNLGTTCSNSTTKLVTITAQYVTRTSGNFSDYHTWNVYSQTGATASTSAIPASVNSVDVQHALTQDANYTSSTYFAITGSGSITIQPNKSFSSDGGVVLFNNKSVTVKSDVTGTGEIGKIVNAISGATNVTVERYTDARKATGPSGTLSGAPRRAWRLLTSPVTGQSIHQAWQENAAQNADPNHPYGTLLTGELLDASTAASRGFDYIGNGNHTSIRRYDSVANNWAILETNGTIGTNMPLNSHQAYMVFVRGDRSVTVTSSIANLRATGTLGQGTQPIAVRPNGPSTNYTLVGNPYAATLDFGQIASHNTGVIANQFYTWNSHLANYGAYVLVTPASGGLYQATPSPYTATPAVNNNFRYIQSGSAFFVSPATNASSTTMNIIEGDKSTGNAPPLSAFRELPSDMKELQVNLNLKDSDTSSTLADGFRAGFDNEFSSDVDNDDIVKASNFNENLGLGRSGKNLIIEARGDVQKTDTLFLKMWNVTLRNYQLEMRATNFAKAPGTEAWLVDKYTGTKQPISLAGDIVSFNFAITTDTMSFNADRFMIVFQNSAVILPVTLTSVKAAPKNGGVAVTWTVTNEANVKGYTIEKSTDGGQTFTAVGTQQPARNNAGAAVTSYNGFDAQPKLGDNLYRIRIEAKDGTITYSTVVKVTIGSNRSGIEITVYPNPVRDGKVNMQFTNLEVGTYLVSVYASGSGQTVYQRKVSISMPNTTQSEQLILGKGLAQGSYELRVADHKGVIIKETQLVIGR